MQTAFKQLVLEKGYEATTVDDICRLAGIARSTFYVHYRNKDDLKRDGIGRARPNAAAERAKEDAPRDGFGFVLPLLRHAHDNLDHIRALSGGRGTSVALVAIRDMLVDTVRQELRAQSRRGTVNETTVGYVVGAFMGVMTAWLEGGASESPETIAAEFDRLSAGLRANAGR